MVTGAVAAIVYGEPRLTHDIDVVVALRADDAPRLAAAFPAPDFYVPPRLRRHLVDLNADYVTARYPDAVTGVPYEVYDRPTAERKVAAAEELFAWL